MDVKIGMINNVKELVLDMGDDANPDDVTADIEKQIAAGGMVRVTDAKGKQVAVVADKLAYVEIGGQQEASIGFG